MKEKLLRALGKGMIPLGLVLLLVSLSASAQERTVTGKVTDEKDQGLPGVSVTVKGSTRGSNADAEGNYSLTAVKDGDILVFSSIGYVKQELGVGSRSVVDVKMVPDASTLEEVVVTALGIQRDKKALTYATQQIGGQELRQAANTNFVDALNGKAAGY
jgi:hypothetical protein